MSPTMKPAPSSSTAVSAPPAPQPPALPVPPLAAFRHVETLRVRWVEIDLQQVVFNAHYLTYIDTAVAGYWRATALPYAATVQGLGGDLFVRRATLDYQAPARYDDRLRVGVRCAGFGRSSTQWQALIARGERTLVTGQLTYVWADPTAERSVEMPAALRSALQAFEAGEPMVDLRFVSDAPSLAAMQELRHRVFAQEQGIDAALMSDAHDANARHVVAVNRLGRVVGAGRWVDAGQGIAKIGRMCADPATRGAGIGGLLLRALMDDARLAGCHHAELMALLPADAFYARAGFMPSGPVETVAGLPHRPMRLAL